MKRFFVISLLFSLCLASISFTACKGNSEKMERDEKLTILDAKIKKNPNDAELYYQRGQILLELQKVNEAIVDFLHATELDDKKPAYFTALGNAYFMNGDVANSYEALQNALSLDPKNLEALNKLAEISYLSKDYERAMETLNKVTEQDKNNQIAFFMKGSIYKETGDTAKAVQYFRRVIELYPDNSRAYEELGLIYAAEKNILAEEYLTTAVRLDSTNVNTLYNLAMLYQDLEEAEKAINIYVRILEIDPQNKWAWHNRGYIEMVLFEDYDSAIEFFTKAIDADSQFLEAHFNRGIAYETKGDRNNARLCFQAALSINPEYAPAKEALNRVK